MGNKGDFIQKTQHGGIKDLKSFFESFYPQVYRLAQKYLNDKFISHDMAQESFVGFWMKINDFSTIESAKKYIYTSVKNRCLNHLRDSKKLTPLELDSFEKENFIRDAIIENETYKLIYDAIADLSPQSQRVIEYSLDGLKNAEIAKILDISINTVKTIKLRAFESMRSRLKKNIFLTFLFSL